MTRRSHRQPRPSSCWLWKARYFSDVEMDGADSTAKQILISRAPEKIARCNRESSQIFLKFISWAPMRVVNHSYWAHLSEFQLDTGFPREICRRVHHKSFNWWMVYTEKFPPRIHFRQRSSICCVFIFTCSHQLFEGHDQASHNFERSEQQLTNCERPAIRPQYWVKNKSIIESSLHRTCSQKLGMTTWFEIHSQQTIWFSIHFRDGSLKSEVIGNASPKTIVFRCRK
jgi:hypothetical protein